ncbi:MAG: FecCD family ABC transporter permease [Bacillota bacterium]
MNGPNWLVKLRLILPASLFCLAVALIAGIALGSVKLAPVTVGKILLTKLPLVGDQLVPHWPHHMETIIWQVRLPRVILATLVGATLAVAGTAFQGLLQNPLADPYTLGVSSGAAAAAAFTIVFGVSRTGAGLLVLPVAAFLGGLGTVILVYRIAISTGRLVIHTLILAGIIVGSFMSALLMFFIALAGDGVHQILAWLMGSLAFRGWGQVWMLVLLLALGLAIILTLSRDLNLLVFGEESAQQLGSNTEHTKKLLLLAATLMTGGAVAAAGTIGFVGLVVPHVMRLLVGPDHRVLVPASAIAGGLFLVLADTAARTVLAPVELPVGVVTATLGAPFFLFILISKRHPARS